MTNRQQFVASYARRMRTHSDGHPGLYVRPAEGADAAAHWLALADYTAGNMLGQPGFSGLSNPLRATLKELGVEPTLKAAKDYLTGAAPGDTLSHE